MDIPGWRALVAKRLKYVGANLTAGTGASLDLTTDHDQAIDAAVKRFSKDRPRQLAVDIADTGSAKRIVISGDGKPVESFDGRHNIDRIEAPADSDDPEAVEDWDVIRNPDKTYSLRKTDGFPSGSMRLYYSGPHALSSTEDTITEDNPNDQEPVICMAVSDLCDRLANFYADKRASQIPADAVDWGALSDKWEKRAARWEKRYLALIAPSSAEDTEEPYSEQVDWKLEWIGGGEDHAEDVRD